MPRKRHDAEPAELKAMRQAARAVMAVRKGTDTLARVRSQLGFPFTAPTVPGGVELLPKPKRTGIDYETDWARKAPARYARALLLEGAVRGGVRLLAAPDRRGEDRLADLLADDDPPPVIFAANHHSHLDTPLLLTSIPEPWRHTTVVAAAADYFFGNRVTGALSALALNAIPVDRKTVNRRSADQAVQLIRDGWSLVIFPEGGRSPDGWGQPFRAGAAFIALRAGGVPIVPVHLEGTGAIYGKGAKRPKPGRTTVTFGAPLRPADGDDARSLGERIERAVTELADEVASDWWSARRRAAAGATPPLGGPETTSWRRAWALSEQRRAERTRRRQRRSWPDLG